jgi:DNA replication protein DnaC
MKDKRKLILDYQLKQLRVPSILRDYKQFSEQCSSEDTDYEEYLFRLTEREVLDRDTRLREKFIKSAKYPSIKSLETFDFKEVPSLNQPLVTELSRSEFIDKRENVIIVGNSGTGKTHIATAIGINACNNKKNVRFYTAATLAFELMEARDDRSLQRFLKRISKYKLLIIDEMGYVPLSKVAAELLFEIFSRRYEQGSILITSNLPFDEWTQIFGDERLTGALLDRLTHHVHILEMNGESYRLKHSKKNKQKKS